MLVELQQDGHCVAIRLAVSAWLNDLMWFGVRSEAAGTDDNWLLDSGLHAAIRGGSLTSA